MVATAVEGTVDVAVGTVTAGTVVVEVPVTVELGGVSPAEEPQADTTSTQAATRTNMRRTGSHLSPSSCAPAATEGKRTTTVPADTYRRDNACSPFWHVIDELWGSPELVT